jgi:hypothetical protein
LQYPAQKRPINRKLAVNMTIKRVEYVWLVGSFFVRIIYTRFYLSSNEKEKEGKEKIKKKVKLSL